MPSIQNYQIPGISVGGYLQPKLAHKFSLTFQLKPNVAMAAGTSDYLSLQTNRCSRPSLDFEKVTISRYQTQVHVPGRYKWSGSIEFTVDDDIGGYATSLIQAQLNVQQQIIGASGGSSEFPSAAGANSYKFLGILTQYDGQNSVPIEQWQLEGCYFERVNWGENTYENGGQKMTIAISLSYDNAIQIINGNTADDTAIAGFSPSTLVV